MFKFTNFVTPGTIYHGTVSGGGAGGDAAAAEVSLKVYLETKVPGITTSDFETKQVGEDCLPCVTQDNTPPGPIFKARLLRAPSTWFQCVPNGTFSESCRPDLSNGTLFGTDALLAVWSNRALKIGRPGGVLSCVTCVTRRE